MNITREKIETFLTQFQSKKALIIGDVMIDAYKIGKANRISPEAPVPVINIEKEYERLGGAANVALNIKSLGAEPILCSVVGNSKNAEIFVNLMRENNLSTEAIINDPDRITTVKTRVMASGQQLLRIDEEIDSQLSKETQEKLVQKIKEICNNQKIDVLILEDYDKGVINKEIIEETLKIAKTLNIPTTVDPKVRNFANYQGATMFKPNFQEFSIGLKNYSEKVNLNNLESISKKFLEENNIENLLLTLSENGIFISNKTEHYHFPAEKRDIIDVSGAGDTVITVASLLLSLNASLAEIAYISNIAGGLVCEKVGVVPITKNELILNFK